MVLHDTDTVDSGGKLAINSRATVIFGYPVYT